MTGIDGHRGCRLADEIEWLSRKRSSFRLSSMPTSPISSEDQGAARSRRIVSRPPIAHGECAILDDRHGARHVAPGASGQRPRMRLSAMPERDGCTRPLAGTGFAVGQIGIGTNRNHRAVVSSSALCSDAQMRTPVRGSAGRAQERAGSRRAGPQCGTARARAVATISGLHSEHAVEHGPPGEPRTAQSRPRCWPGPCGRRVVRSTSTRPGMALLQPSAATTRGPEGELAAGATVAALQLLRKPKASPARISGMPASSESDSGMKELQTLDSKELSSPALDGDQFSGQLSAATLVLSEQTKRDNLGPNRCTLTGTPTSTLQQAEILGNLGCRPL